MIDDLVGLGKPLKKLIEVIAKGIGGLSSPILTRKNADAKAYEIKTISEAMAESQKLLGPIVYEKAGIKIETPLQALLPEPSPENRVLARISYQEAKKQNNIENITRIAADQFTEEEVISDEPVDDDWITRFFQNAENISNEMMQSLWGKILSGEVKKPGSFSLRTMELLRNITKNEADVFSLVAKYAIHSGQHQFLFNPDNNQYLEKQCKIHFDNLLLLRDLNLLHPNNDLAFVMNQVENEDNTMIRCGSSIYLLKRPKGAPKTECPIIAFTEIGKQLIQLNEKESADAKYMQHFFQIFKEDGVTVLAGENIPGESKIALTSFNY